MTLICVSDRKTDMISHLYVLSHLSCTCSVWAYAPTPYLLQLNIQSYSPAGASACAALTNYGSYREGPQESADISIGSAIFAYGSRGRYTNLTDRHIDRHVTDHVIPPLAAGHIYR